MNKIFNNKEHPRTSLLWFAVNNKKNSTVVIGNSSLQNTNSNYNPYIYINDNSYGLFSWYAILCIMQMQ